MEYEILTPTSPDFNVDRSFEIVKEGFAEAGVDVTQKVGGDATAAYALETDDNCDGEDPPVGYDAFDIAMWDWVGYIDPDFMLSVVTKGQWCSWSDTGWDNPEYDKMYDEQGTPVDPEERKQLVWEMQQMIYDNFVYTQLANHEYIDAHSKTWAGIKTDPERVLEGVLDVALHGRVDANRTKCDGGRGVRSADYVIKRVLFALVTVFVAITLNFVLFRAVPGDAVDALRCRQCSAEFKEPSRQELGLDQSHVDAVQALRERPRPRRSRHLAAHQKEVRGTSSSEPLKNTLPMIALGTALRDHLRHAHGGDLRLAAGHGLDKAGLWTSPRLLLDADPVARAAHGPLRRRRARAADVGHRGPDAGRASGTPSTWDVLVGPAAAHDPAGADARARAVRRLRADRRARRCSRRSARTTC